MLIKIRDATPSRIARLERMVATESDPLRKIEIRHGLARLRADTTRENACAFLNRYFADYPDWMLLHDLRLCIDHKFAHANHVLIDRGLRFYWLDTRYIDYGLSISESGGCTVNTVDSRHAIACPLNKLRKNLRVFENVIRNSQLLPRWSALLKSPVVKGFVLTNPALKNSIPASNKSASVQLISKDNLFRMVWKNTEGENGLWSRDESESSLLDIAQALADQHQPLISQEIFSVGARSESRAPATDVDTSHCYHCGAGVAEDERQYSFRNMDLYGGKVLCLKCQICPQVQQLTA